MHKRSLKREIMDLGSDHYTHQEYEDCLEKLFQIGMLTGIHRDTFRQLKRIHPKSILDIGCGDGRFLVEIAKQFPTIECRGIDISEQAIDIAKKYQSKKVSFSCTEELACSDVIMANLVCHHMTDNELISFLKQGYKAAQKAVIINDLQRHQISKTLFQLLSPRLFKNRLILEDGVTSIEKGFWKSEWEHLLHQAEIAKCSYEILWRFPFRWQVLLWKR